LDIKWKKYSHSLITKVIVFLITVACFTGAVTTFINTAISLQGNFGPALEDNYYISKNFSGENNQIAETLITLVGEYKSEEHILNGGTIEEDEIEREEDTLFSHFQNFSKSYNPNLSTKENYQLFREVYSDKISKIRGNLIEEDLKQYNLALRKLEGYRGLIYYISDGNNVFTNSSNTDKNYFKSQPSYIIFDKSEETIYPAEIKESNRYFWVGSNINPIGQQNNAMYIAFTPEFLDPRVEEWGNNKVLVTNSLYKIIGFSSGLAVSFIYLLWVIGRKPSEDEEIHLGFVDRIHNDLNVVMCFILIALWFGAANLLLFENNTHGYIFDAVTFLIATLGLIMVLSLVRHIKRGTIIKHTLIYIVLKKLSVFIKEIYDSGSVGVKIVLIVIGYPVLVALTFFMFPVTIGVGVWIALKKVKEFNAIKEGVDKAKKGDYHHKIDVAGNGEFAGLAFAVNSITDGLKKAVANELKSERLKTELITNVSHDIRTPLTSIITYVDLLKNETDPEKSQEYIKIIEQKSDRLKILTDDLFEASKASSGNIPVNYENIDIVSLINQGMGELDDKIRESELEFKFNYTSDKVNINADGKLLWRAIENLLSNIFKYALKGSRVYIDIEDSGTEVMLIFKNISAYQLNISTDELMERFKRGDESRGSQGSGLGLSITKSLINIQRGSFNIQIDGDLFKAIIQMPK